MNWIGWPIERILVLFVGTAFFMIFVQVTLFHYRQNFRHWSMWIPVLATPLLGFLSIYLAFKNVLWVRYLLVVSLLIGVVAGMFGSYMHVRGVGERVGGYELRNFMIGPPLVMPALISAISVLGLIALLWG